MNKSSTHYWNYWDSYLPWWYGVWFTEYLLCPGGLDLKSAMVRPGGSCWFNMETQSCLAPTGLPGAPVKTQDQPPMASDHWHWCDRHPQRPPVVSSPKQNQKTQGVFKNKTVLLIWKHDPISPKEILFCGMSLTALITFLYTLHQQAIKGFLPYTKRPWAGRFPGSGSWLDH